MLAEMSRVHLAVGNSKLEYRNPKEFELAKSKNDRNEAGGAVSNISPRKFGELFRTSDFEFPLAWGLVTTHRSPFTRTPPGARLVGCSGRTRGRRSPAEVDQITQNVQRLVAFGINGGFFGSVVVTGQIRVGVGGGFRGNFLFR
jgi:hypothetical protein